MLIMMTKHDLECHLIVNHINFSFLIFKTERERESGRGVE